MGHDDTGDLKQGFSSLETQQALKSLRALEAEPSPYLKTRVLAHAREQKKTNVSFFKKYFLQSAMAMCLVFALGFFLIQKNQTAAVEVAAYKMDQPYVIRMDIRPYKESGIAYAEIVLDNENIQFTSSQYEQIKQQRKLTVAWDSVVEKQFLPIVIKGVKSGTSKVIVNFYDSENKLVTSENVNLNFKGG